MNLEYKATDPMQLLCAQTCSVLILHVCVYVRYSEQTVLANNVDQWSLGWERGNREWLLTASVLQGLENAGSW